MIRDQEYFLGEGRFTEIDESVEALTREVGRTAQENERGIRAEISRYVRGIPFPEGSKKEQEKIKDEMFIRFCVRFILS